MGQGALLVCVHFSPPFIPSSLANTLQFQHILYERNPNNASQGLALTPLMTGLQAGGQQRGAVETGGAGGQA